MVILKNGYFSKMLTLAVLAIGFAVSVKLVSDTYGGGVVSLVIGAPPWNLSLSVGALEAFMSCLFTGISLIIMWASVSMIDHDILARRIPLYHALICWLMAMLLGVIYFDNLFNAFIFIDISSFAAACIVIIKDKPENLRAGIKYIALSILGSGFILMGIVVLYSTTGQLSLAAIRTVFQGGLGESASAVLYAVAFITLGVGFKSALFPMHIWLPDAHGTAPSPSSAVLSALVLKAYIIFYMKILYSAIGQDIIASDEMLTQLLFYVLVLGAAAMLAGSIFAILQTDIKRMVAYSSVSQIGYIFMGIGLGTELGLYAAAFHIVAHAVTKAGLFLVAGSIIDQTQNRNVKEMGGIGYQMPVTMVMFAIGGLSMIGIPMFLGFNSKWNFAVAIIDSGMYWVMAAVAISALLNAMYYMPVIIRAFFGEKAREASEKHESFERPVKHLMPIMLLSLVVIVLGVYSALIVAIIESGVSTLWGS